MRKKYEGSPADNAKDAKRAKAKGVTKAQFEGSPEDRREDAKGQKALDKAQAKRRGK